MEEERSEPSRSEAELREVWERAEKLEPERQKWAAALPPPLIDSLMGFQREGVVYALRHGGRLVVDGRSYGAGCCYFKKGDPVFAAQLAEWQAQGLLLPWDARPWAGQRRRRRAPCLLV